MKRANILRLRAVLAILTLAVAVAANACGGDDNSTDRSYVSDTCKARLAFQTATEADSVSPQKADAAVGDLVLALSKTKPPTDAKSYQDQTIRFLTDARKQVAKNGVLAFEILDAPLPPRGVGARLDAIALKDQDCVRAAFTFED